MTLAKNKNTARASKNNADNPQTLATKERILFAAKKEFARKGFAGARMDNIAKMADANKAMIHYYFNSKEKLYKELLLSIMGRGIKDMLPIYSGERQYGPTQKLAGFIYFVVNVHFDCFDPEFHKMMAWDAAEGNNHWRILAEQVFAPAIERLESIIEEGIQSGEFKSEYPVFEVWSIISFLVHYMRSRELFESSSIRAGIRKKLYPKNAKQAVIDFLMSHVFRALTVTDTRKIRLDEDLKNIVDAKIKSMKNCFSKAEYTE